MGHIEAQQEIFKLVGYEPTDEQAAIHADQTRSKLIVGGERAGKSKVDSKELLKHWWVDVAAPKKDGACMVDQRLNYDHKRTGHVVGPGPFDRRKGRAVLRVRGAVEAGPDADLQGMGKSLQIHH